MKLKVFTALSFLFLHSMAVFSQASDGNRDIGTLGDQIKNISDRGGPDHLAKFLRESIAPVKNLEVLRAEVNRITNGKTLLIPADYSLERLNETNKRLRDVGIDFIQFFKNEKLSQPTLSKEFMVWMTARALTIPIVSFLSVYFIALHETSVTQRLLLEAGKEARDRGDLMSPYMVAGGVIFLSMMFGEVAQILNKPWMRKDTNINKLDIFYSAGHYLSIPLAQVAGILAATRPLNSAWQSVYFPDSATSVIMTHLFMQFFTYGLTQSILNKKMFRGEISPINLYALDSFLLTYIQISSIFLLASRTPEISYAMAATFFVTVTAPLLLKQKMGNTILDRETSLLLDPKKRSSLSGAKRICARIVGKISGLYTLPISWAHN